MSNHAIIRISRELQELRQNPNLSLSVASKDSDIRDVRAIIIGPYDTPYQFGFFEFDFRFPSDYPRKSPAVRCRTTNQGRTRFNPNVYASGKVCLSILGTWRGEPGEQWSSVQGLESILLSIQSLLSPNPYENEPGFERRSTPEDCANRQHYVDKIHHETLRISVIQCLEKYLGITKPLLQFYPKSTKSSEEPPVDTDEDDELPIIESPEPFQDLCKQRFLWYYDSYIEAVDQGIKAYPGRFPFMVMPFETPGNQMIGAFDYMQLRVRLSHIKAVLDNELDVWAKAGAETTEKYASLTTSFKAHLDACVRYLTQREVAHHIHLEGGNPLVWVLTYFGAPMTQLDGAVLSIRIHWSPKFPTEQPRVRLATHIFHHRVTSDGMLCYLPKKNKTDDAVAHLQGILEAVELEALEYNPMMLANPEANRLLWGLPGSPSSTESKKVYSRKLRRSVQEIPG